MLFVFILFAYSSKFERETLKLRCIVLLKLETSPQNAIGNLINIDSLKLGFFHCEDAIKRIVL